MSVSYFTKNIRGRIRTRAYETAFLLLFKKHIHTHPLLVVLSARVARRGETEGSEVVWSESKKNGTNHEVSSLRGCSVISNLYAGKEGVWKERAIERDNSREGKKREQNGEREGK